MEWSECVIAKHVQFISGHLGFVNSVNYYEPGKNRSDASLMDKKNRARKRESIFHRRQTDRRGNWFNRAMTT